ncbi:Hypothetical protein SRAE_X000054200 [Strongyloides ratti]|uniref:Uncharacterized protein n=1 Tax=Strongyloides ratti TaxID=34506 RepID=A0A090LN20_STRRB|nr:Hypothetical protein SRAE_X000054200 [Strongyloides ratti]CEF71215.1 Hypothetical protein SRAE_X000054200 [Strongyloides ratti]
MKNVDSKGLKNILELNNRDNKEKQINTSIIMRDNLTNNSLQPVVENVIEGSEKFPTLLAAIRKVDTPPRIHIEEREINDFPQQLQSYNFLPQQYNTDGVEKSIRRKYVKKSKIPNITNENNNYPLIGEEIIFNCPSKRGPKRFKSMESTKVDESSQNYNYTNYSTIAHESYIPENIINDYNINNSNPLSRISFNPNYPFDDGDENIRNNHIDNSIPISQYFPDNYNNNIPQNNTNYLNNQINYQYPKQIINNTTLRNNFQMYNNLPENGQNYINNSNNIINPQPYNESSKNYTNSKIINNNRITSSYSRKPINYLSNMSYFQYQNMKNKNGVIYNNNININNNNISSSSSSSSNNNNNSSNNGSNGGANNLTKNLMNNERKLYNINTNNINISIPPNTINSNTQNNIAQTYQAQTRYHTNFPNIHPNTRSNIVDGNYNNFYQNTFTENSQNTLFAVEQQTSQMYTRTDNIVPINNESYNYQNPKYQTFSNVNKCYDNTQSVSRYTPLNSSSSSLYNINSYEKISPNINKYQYNNQESLICYQNLEEV